MTAVQRLDVVEFVEVARALGIDARDALTVLSEAVAPQARSKEVSRRAAQAAAGLTYLPHIHRVDKVREWQTTSTLPIKT